MKQLLRIPYFFLALTRFILFFQITIIAILIIMFLCLFHKDKVRAGIAYRRNYIHFILWMLGVKVHVKGEIPVGTYVYISNHRSYIDPSVILKHIIAMPVAKAEVSKWPVIGYGTKVTGVLFVERDSKESRGNTLKGMLKCMQSGLPVLIFPEGTTHDQKQCIEFRRGAFEMAADNGFPVLPMALEYGKRDDAWIGDDTFVPHFFRCFAKPRTHAYLHFGQPISSSNRDELISKCEAFINQELAEMPAWT